MARKPHKDDFLHLPEYPGGKKAIQQLISDNLRYPEKALENKTEGTVLISYRIGFNGSTSEIKVLKGIGDGCDEEAIRLVGLLKFSPQNNHGLKVTTVRKIRIHFRLHVPKKSRGMSFKYEVKESSKKPVEQKQHSTYTYTIKI